MRADDFFGGITRATCYAKSNAFRVRGNVASDALPADYEGDFAERVRQADCCAVIRHGRRDTHPRRCRSVRRLWNPNEPEKAMECCYAHRAQEGKARAWVAAQVAT